LALSPDGAHAYAVSDPLDSVLHFTRDPDSGALAFGTRYSAASAGFTAALLDGARDVTVSPDGLHLYVAARNSGAIVVLQRDLGDGTLSFVQNQQDSSLAGVNALRVSADGLHLYASGGVANAIAVYGRDALTGELGLLEAERSGIDDASDAGGMVLGLDRPSGLALSADGGQVYVAARFGNAVLAFERVNDSASADFGKLSFAGSQRNGLGGVQGLAGAYDLVLSPDGRHLYVIGESSNSVVLFDRSQAGALSWRSMWRKSDPGIFGLGGPQGIAMAPNGKEVFVVGFADSSLTIFRRALTEGATTLAGDLTVRQTVLDGEGQVDNMQGPAAVVASQDDQFIYVSAAVDNAILQFRRTSYDVIFGDDEGGFE
jgi:6-phosphogluconolactonase (cycloisomerase 2 family)